MQNQLAIVPTADGSNTIFNAEVGENYHSRHGALQESRHVFLDAGLKYFLSVNQTGTASILEVGFGTGLNFLLSADYCIAHKINLIYNGIEAYPLRAEMIAQTGYGQYVSPELWHQLVNCYPNPIKTAHYQLELALYKLLDFQSSAKFDIIYYDAFGAERQPEMWDETAISHVINLLKPGGVFVTYAITGNLKRMLKGLGLNIQKIPGAAGKREMLRAVR